MFFREKKSGNRSYLQLVENYRDNGKTKQRVISTIGRMDRLIESGELDRLIVSGARFTESIMVLSENENGETPEADHFKIGPPLVFERLWEKTGCMDIIKKMTKDRKHCFSIERAIFLTVLHRIFESGSDRAANKWRCKYKIRDVDSIELHHLYRAMAWLGEELDQCEQKGRTPFVSRCTKDRIEEELFDKNRDLFSELDMVFFDTTSIYFEGQGGESLGRKGNSKDHRPDRNQVVVGLVIDGSGRPICCELWPGNTTDVKTLIPIVDRLRKRFRINQICIVADRGMISKETIKELESYERDWFYILGARMRNQKEVRDDVLGRGGCYKTVHEERKNQKDPSPLKVKEIWVKDRRYILCLNESEKRKNEKDRKAILESLKEKLDKGEKSLVGNKGYRRYVKSRGQSFYIDEEKVKKEARYDGKWVLRTNTTLDKVDVALKYKQLWMVESMFRTTKTILDTRPIFHKYDATIKGHIFCSFLSLVLIKELKRRLELKGYGDLEWSDILNDLDDLTETLIEQKGKRFLLRSKTKGTCGKVFQSVGVAIPPTVRFVKNMNA